MSEEHKSLADALLAFQAECPTLPKDSTNPHFRSKFTSLDTMVETVRPLLAKHGLVWTTLPSSDEQGNPMLEYRLMHARPVALLDDGTGRTFPLESDSITGRMPLLLTKNDPQGMGSALTYARRYALASVLNLVADDDDDGNGSSPRQQPRNSGWRQPEEKPRVDFRSAAAGLNGAQIREAFKACALTPPGGEVPSWQLFDNVPANKAEVLAEALRSIER